MSGLVVGLTKVLALGVVAFVAFVASGVRNVTKVATKTVSKAMRFTRISCHLGVRFRHISTIVGRRHEQRKFTINTTVASGASC